MVVKISQNVTNILTNNFLIIATDKWCKQLFTKNIFMEEEQDSDLSEMVKSLPTFPFVGNREQTYYSLSKFFSSEAVATLLLQ